MLTVTPRLLVVSLFCCVVIYTQTVVAQESPEEISAASDTLNEAEQASIPAPPAPALMRQPSNFSEQQYRQTIDRSLALVNGNAPAQNNDARYVEWLKQQQEQLRLQLQELVKQQSHLLNMLDRQAELQREADRRYQALRSEHDVMLQERQNWQQDKFQAPLLSRQIADLNNQKHVAEQQIAELRQQAEQIPGLQEQLAAISKERDALRQQLDERQQSAATQAQKLTEQTALLDALQTENAELKTQLMTLESQLAAAKQTVEAATTDAQQRAAMEEQLAQQTGQLETLQQQLATAEQNNAELTRQLEAAGQLQSEHASLQQTLAQQQTALEEKQSALSQAQTQLAELTAAQETQQAEQAAAASQMADLQASVAALESQNQALQSQLDQVKTQLQDKDAQLAGIAQEKIGLVTEAKAQQAQLKKQMVALETALRSANAEKDRLSQALADNDGDGIANAMDQCPESEAGVLVDRHGCESDIDEDGIADRLDLCPTPVDGEVDELGCPVNQNIALEGVNFEIGTAQLTEASLRSLDKVVAVLQRFPKLRLEVAGHTDNIGARQRNLSLSAARAEAVKAYLESKGIEAERLLSKGYGPDEPAADNQTDEGRAANRRVELRRVND